MIPNLTIMIGAYIVLRCADTFARPWRDRRRVSGVVCGLSALVAATAIFLTAETVQTGLYGPQSSLRLPTLSDFGSGHD